MPSIVFGTGDKTVNEIDVEGNIYIKMIHVKAVPLFPFFR